MKDVDEQIRSSNRKGELGEFKLDVQFSLLPKEYRYLNDLLIKTRYGYSQIDHVVISPAGIYVVETKNFNGKVFGKKNDRNWTVCCGPQKNHPYNPISQNATHIKVIQNVLRNFNNLRYYSIISFTRRAVLTGVDMGLRTADSDVMVSYDTDVSRFIMRKAHLVLGVQRKSSISQGEIDKINLALSNVNILDEVARQEHVKQIQQRKNY